MPLALDGKLLRDFQPNAKTMYAVASKAANGDVILKVVNASGRPQTTDIKLSGLKGNVASASATVLAAASLDAENTLDEPAKVVPVVRPVSIESDRFSHAFPAYSVTVLQLRVAP